MLTASRKSVLLNEVLHLAVKLHAERLRVHSTKARWVYPNSRMTGSASISRCLNVTTRGVDADMVLYVAAGPGLPTWAVPCAVDGHARPVAGAVQACVSDVDALLSGVCRVADVMAHALGLDVGEVASHNMLLGVPDVRGQRLPRNCRVFLRRVKGNEEALQAWETKGHGAADVG
ncbi:putative surface protease GP63 [Trypanosoma conorhini]|uniref:Leishmanolysin-like peptidase n=1 Tax=Trypanosoma conorhini TaxID=83891 RepID=A0A3R7N7X0_9TRYP|nr:putative surface protease GP63 [Trypanosoma conorhini]RNF17738.1 putative surface protease GP63 [Trypanosoma conorhini]